MEALYAGPIEEAVEIFEEMVREQPEGWETGHYVEKKELGDVLVKVVWFVCEMNGEKLFYGLTDDVKSEGTFMRWRCYWEVLTAQSWVDVELANSAELAMLSWFRKRIKRDAYAIVACEHSGRVATALNEIGVKAISIDILPTETPSTPHIVGDVRDYVGHEVDLMVAFPPCLYLAVASL